MKRLPRIYYWLIRSIIRDLEAKQLTTGMDKPNSAPLSLLLQTVNTSEHIKIRPQNMVDTFEQDQSKQRSNHPLKINGEGHPY